MHTTVHQASVAPANTTTTVHYPVAVQSNVSQPGVSEKFNSNAGRATGYIQLICGIASILIAIIEIVLGSPLSVVGYGIWAGLLFYGPTGILGIFSHGKNTCTIIAYMVMSVITAQIAFSMFIFQAIAAGVNAGVNHYWSCAEWGVAKCGEDAWNARTAMAAILSVIGVVEMVVAIVASAYCCGGVCCGSTPTQQHTVVQYTSGTPMVVTAGPQPQPMVYGHPAVQPYQPAPAYYQPQQQPGYAAQPPQQPGYSTQPPAYSGQVYQQQQPPMYQPSQAVGGPSAPMPHDAQPQKA